MSSDKIPPLRSHDWIITAGGRLYPSNREKESIQDQLLKRQRHAEASAAGIAASKPESENVQLAYQPIRVAHAPAPPPIPAREPAKPVLSQHDKNVREVSALMSKGYSYSEAMDKILDGVEPEPRVGLRAKAFAACDLVDRSIDSAITALKKPLAATTAPSSKAKGKKKNPAFAIFENYPCKGFSSLADAIPHAEKLPDGFRAVWLLKTSGMTSYMITREARMVAMYDETPKEYCIRVWEDGRTLVQQPDKKQPESAISAKALNFGVTG